MLLCSGGEAKGEFLSLVFSLMGRMQTLHLSEEFPSVQGENITLLSRVTAEVKGRSWPELPDKECQFTPMNIQVWFCSKHINFYQIQLTVMTFKGFCGL